LLNNMQRQMLGLHSAPCRSMALMLWLDW
jgi:hypothetical protein